MQICLKYFSLSICNQVNDFVRELRNTLRKRIKRVAHNEFSKKYDENFILDASTRYLRKDFAATNSWQLILAQLSHDGEDWKEGNANLYAQLVVSLLLFLGTHLLLICCVAHH